MKSKYLLIFCTLLVCLANCSNAGLVPDGILDGIHNTAKKVNDVIVFGRSEEDDYEAPPRYDPTQAVHTTQKAQPVPTPEATTEPSPPPTTVASVNGTTTVKDGRENFAGGCSTGYKRTADGRCMPTY